ncbi:MAG TPA: response regulator [Myxococcota bacterium]|nr:response regulator [Myxococcota bacterium]HQK51803.1 response regulator [Myxococcota bacterium]
MAPKVLIVEDEADFADIVAMNLRRGGLETVTVRTGEAALAEVAHRRPDVVLLDLMLPDLQGTEVCRRIRSDPATRSLPILMVTARGEEIDRVVGLELGADDYLVKPVSMRELVLRVQAVLRRRSKEQEPETPSASFPGLRVDGPAHRVFVEGQEVALTPTEFRLLAVLVTPPLGRVLTRETLLDRVWGQDSEVEIRTVDTVMKRLRDKLGPAGAYLETVRGVGYRFRDPILEQ